MFLIFDTETTGFPRDWNAPYTDTSNWPRVVQIAWQLHDEMGRLIEHKDFLIRPDGFDIPYDAEKVHGISTELAQVGGDSLEDVFHLFNKALSKATFLVGQNLNFDLNVAGCEFVRLGQENLLHSLPVLDTCTEYTAELCQLPGGKGGRPKLPTLTELHLHLFSQPFVEAHNATADVEATTRCFFELIRLEHFTLEQLQQRDTFFEEFKEFNTAEIALIGLKHVNLKEESRKLKEAKQRSQQTATPKTVDGVASDLPFAHLHNHTQFSILQSTIDVNGLVSKAVELEMPAVALTDTGNMMAAFHFEKAVSSYNKNIKAEREKALANGESFDKKELLPIIGCEFNVCRNLEDKTQKDNGYQVVFLAKNKAGYHNLVKLASIAYTKGMYYVPRVDKKVIEQYCSDLIVLSGNLYGEIPQLILNVGEKQAEESLLWWKELFGEDFYLEVMRHGQENEDRVNETLIRFAQNHGVKLVATNNTYYLDKKDAEAHDVLLCVKDGELVSTPKGRGRGYRYGLDNEEYYFKSSDEMKRLFADLPQAIESIGEIIAKCEPYGLAREVLLPAFDIPAEFQDPMDLEDGGKRGENNYLKFLTYEGAKRRYTEITDEIRERLDFELATIEKTGYPGYFLIVQDFCQAARDMGVSVGPGRGSAAGSAVAYCIGITNVDPIEYDLLFERFLNPDRVSMPDIDIDFDDEGRGRVIDWVINKYGSNQVAQIITYGTMAAKSSIRDTARVLDLPLPDADRIAKLVPDISLAKLFKMSDPELADKLKNNQDDITRAKHLKAIADGNNLEAKVVKQAVQLEGSVRNTGIHACGVIITPDDITNFVPVATAKDSEMFCTQYDNSVAESAGLLKMDFLGLKTLTLIKDAVKNVKLTKGIDLDPDAFPIDDEKTYELFQRGETVGIFQYESPGMQKYMRELKPTVFADLIAMNALYRPGPLEYIPSFIKRKHGEEPIVYDVDDCEEYLKETYGITVYQEQVMLLSQKLAGFTKGEADTLRKAMGKKQKDVLDKMKPAFIERGSEKGHNADKLEKIWRDWEAFASYAFNKSHSTCYAWIAYQTAYLKANYPAEYMASVLSNNMNDIKQVSFFMEECKRMGLPVLGPDVNESNYQFTVNKEGAVRFGLGAIKGLGSGPVDAIIAERSEGGSFTSIFDLTRRVNLRLCNKKAFESLAYAGGFDSFKGVHRAQYFKEDSSGKVFLENAIKYGAKYQEDKDSPQRDMFDLEDGPKVIIPEPEVPKSEEWGSIYKLNKEKEVIGIFISGHPLDDFRVEIESFCNGRVSMLNEMEQHKGKELTIAAVITEAEHRTTRNGDPFGTIQIEDYNDSYKLFLWRENFLKYKYFMNPGTFVSLKGRIELPPRRNELEFVIHSIDLLQNLKDQKANSIHLKLPAKNLDHVTIMDLNKLFIENSGKCQLHFAVVDQLEGIEVRLNSKTVRIDPNNTVFNELKRMNIEFEIR
jgi:DNA polymerase-3 subunit alpha